MSRTRYTADDGSIQRARERRKDPTLAEKALWSILRGSKLGGHKFRREQRLGPYFGDLVCHEARSLSKRMAIHILTTREKEGMRYGQPFSNAKDIGC